MAAYQRQVRAAERQAELEHWHTLTQQMIALGSVHEDEFPPATAPVAPPVDPVDEQGIQARHEREQLTGLRPWQRSARREAKARAHEAASHEITETRAAQTHDRQQLQAQLDTQWRELEANNPHAVMEAIEAAYEDNEISAAPINVTDAAATVLMKISSPAELVPEREVTRTPAGKLTHKRRTKSTINQLYAEILASHVVATVKEGLAVAPGLDEIAILVIRGDRLGGGSQLIPLYVGHFDRPSVQRSDWENINVLRFIEHHGEIKYKGQAQELAALPTKHDPELRSTLDDLAMHLDWKPAP